MQFIHLICLSIYYRLITRMKRKRVTGNHVFSPILLFNLLFKSIYLNNFRHMVIYMKKTLQCIHTCITVWHLLIYYYFTSEFPFRELLFTSKITITGYNNQISYEFQQYGNNYKPLSDKKLMLLNRISDGYLLVAVSTQEISGCMIWFWIIK